MTEASLHEVIHGSPIVRHFRFEPIEPRPQVSDAITRDIIAECAPYILIHKAAWASLAFKAALHQD
jgi:hypothetical protein